jgi:hypothetical protein
MACSARLLERWSSRPASDTRCIWPGKAGISQALGGLYGDNADVFVAGILRRGSRLARFGDLADDADDLSRLRAFYGEGPEADSLSVVDAQRASLKATRQHHVFPQDPKLRKFFEERGFVGDQDIDNSVSRSSARHTRRSTAEETGGWAEGNGRMSGIGGLWLKSTKTSVISVAS